MHRISGPVQGGVISDRWFDGVWIGLQFPSGEHIVATPDGRVVRARAVHPRPDTVRVTRGALNNIKVGPWNTTEVITQGSGDKPSASAEETQLPQAEEPVPRSFRITLELLSKFGYTKGCPKCEALRRGDEHKSVHHNRECRRRVETEMNKDDVLSRKLSEVEGRKKGYLARRVETSDREKVEARPMGPGDSRPRAEEPDVPADPVPSCVPAEELEDPLECVYSWIECAHDEVMGRGSGGGEVGAALHSRPCSGCGVRPSGGEKGDYVVCP